MQPSEFAKFAAALCLAKFASKTNFRLSKFTDLLDSRLIILLPAALIILQGDTGTALVFGAFVIVLYREGLNPALIGVGLLAIVLFILTLFIDKTYLITGSIAVGRVACTF